MQVENLLCKFSKCIFAIIIITKKEIVSTELIIDVTPSEIKIALLVDKRLAELNREKNNIKFSVGDIYIGRVKKIMAGLNAAFVDIGYEKDAFLHYLDLGPQFNSLDKYLTKKLEGKLPDPSLDSFKLLPDIEKTGKITETLKSGQEVIVQIAKEPISTKGPRLASEISLAGRSLVLLPFSNKVSVSQKIRNTEEKTRLKKLISSIKPKNYGVIVRTVAEGKKVAELDQELRSLVERWENAIKNLKRDDNKYQLVLGELNRTSAILRDILNPSFNNIHINDYGTYSEIKKYIKGIAPEKENIVKQYKKEEPIFEHFGVEKQIKSAFGKTVLMKNGTYLVIEHTEALHSIDVNSGNRIKKTNDQETNATEVNLIAADEIARQLRLRDIGGLIVVDFIDMSTAEHKKALFDRMRKNMKTDRAKHHILSLSKFGLMEITRERVRPEVSIETNEKCPVCKGSGKISSSIIFVDELENYLSYIFSKTNHKEITLKVHPYIEAYINKGVFKSVRKQWVKKFKRKIIVKGSFSYNYLEYHFFDHKAEEVII